MTKILFLAANPLDTDHLRLDEEARAIDLALAETGHRDSFRLITHWAVRVDDLQSLLLRHQPAIVHFSGHGSDASEIVLQTDQGEAVVVPRGALNRLFGLLGEHVRCVVLNACFSEDQAAGIGAQIDCVVGMSDAIGDSAARQFAQAFYRGLAHGRSVAAAFDLGCNQIDLAALGEAHKPVLLGKADPESVHFRPETSPEPQQGDARRPWWTALSPTGGGPTMGDLDLGDVAGDVIVANVGAGSRNVAVGKQIQQSIYNAVGQAQPNDLAVIQGQVAALTQALDPTQRAQAQFPLQLLTTELTKTGAGEAPNGAAVMQAGDFLLDTLPALAEELAALFALPAVGRVLAKTDPAVVAWLQRRLG